MGKVISIFNQKGGVGKTTTTINLSAGVAAKNKNVLVVDMDPQGNSTSGLGVNLDEIKFDIYDVLAESCETEEAVIATKSKGVVAIPSGIDLAGLEVELAKADDWDYILREKVRDVSDKFDYIFIDCPPSLGILSLMSLYASDFVLIPVQAEYYALEGIGQLFETIEMVRQNKNKNLDILGVVMCMYDMRNKLSKEVLDEVRKVFKDKVFDTKILRNVRLAEAPSYGENIFTYDYLSRGAWNYRALSKEFLDRIDKYDK